LNKEFKICKNPDCRKKFYREELHFNHIWSVMRFHNRTCQVNFYNKQRREEKGRRYYHTDTMDFQSIHDACNKYAKEARERLKETVIIYDSKNMSQEELQALVTSVEG